MKKIKQENTITNGTGREGGISAEKEITGTRVEENVLCQERSQGKDLSKVGKAWHIFAKQRKCQSG